MSGKSYKERLGILKLESLAKRRCVFDLVEVYKICHNSSSLSVDKFFQHESCNFTRGHDLKFFKKKFRLHCRNYFFTNGVISEWNRLPPHTALCDSIQNSKLLLPNLLQKSWINFYILYFQCATFVSMPLSVLHVLFLLSIHFVFVLCLLLVFTWPHVNVCDYVVLHSLSIRFKQY